MKKKFIIYDMIGLLFTIIFGSLLHFVYHLSGDNTFFALFSPINESTWEHLKLLFFPFVAYSIFQYFIIGHNYRNFITAKVLGVIIGIISIPLMFYTYTSILLNHYLTIDILIFIISVILAYGVSWYVLKHKSISFNLLSVILLACLIIIFMFFSFHPPEMELFSVVSLF